MSLVTFDHRRNSPRRRSTVVTGLLESTGAQIGRLAGLWSAQISDPLPVSMATRKSALMAMSGPHLWPPKVRTPH